ncbi:ABC transporter permease [Cohnella sp. GCM10027633]|uniref:ABC transporter permease n=1 Tax=unclassified Cohnella TaxID=2636738 RepID=UPI00362FCE9A
MFTIKDKSRQNRKSEWKHFKQNGEYLLLFLPGAFHIFLFGYLPMIGIIIAFKNFRYDQGIWGSEWIGFKNFEFLFTSSTAYRIFRNTLLYESGYLLLTTVAALALAILLNEISRKWLKIYQTPLFLPYFLSWVVVSYLTYALLDHQMGFVNKTLEAIGLKPVMWYLDANVWPYILNIVALWKNIGFATLVYFAGIVGISPEYYESAKIDGASRWKMALKITIPMLTPLIVILIILAIGNIMKGDFGLHYFIPGDSGMVYPTTDIIDTYVYRALIELGDIGMSSSVGVFQSVVGLVLVIVTNYIVRKINEENALW